MAYKKPAAFDPGAEMPDGPKQVLFVDDDAQFLEMLHELLGAQAGDAWEIHTARDVGQALGILAERPISLLVIDIHMPVIDGLQFLALLRQTYPNLLRVVLTGDATEGYRAACLNAGAELFLQKPVDTAGWDEIFTSLNSLAKYQPEHGFRGVLRTVGLQDILQMECLGRSSSVLEIVTRNFHGRIFIHEGQIIHAQAGDLAGEAAFNHLMGLRGGEFNVLPFAEPPQRTISDSWEFLIMEAARKRDEAAGSAPATTVVPENFALFPPKLAAAPAEPAAPREPARLPLAPAGSASAGDSRPRIDEMLVASPHGEVLYLWQCTQPAERIRFLEFVSQRARQLAQGLPLGAFNRLEAESGVTRAVTQMQTDRTIFHSPHGGAGRMKEPFEIWLRDSIPPAGVLGCGVRLPDQSSAARTWSEAFTTDAIDNASRCVADTFQVLKLNRLPARRLRWVYEGAVVLCAHREDGISLTLFTGREDDAVDHAGVTRWIEQFQSGAIG